MNPLISAGLTKALTKAVILASVFLLFGVASSITHRTGASTTYDERVAVVNTPLPVSIQGTGTVAGTVAVSNFPATQPVSGTVAISNLPTATNTVTVENTTTNPVPTASTDLSSPVMITSVSCGFNAGTCMLNLYTVPANSLLVVDDISGFCEIGGSNTFLIDSAFLYTGTSKLAYVALSPIFESTSAREYYIGRETRIYVPANTALQFIAFGVGVNLGSCDITMHGHLINQ